MKDRLKDIFRPPLTQEWLDSVAAGREDMAREIERKRGPVAAAKYRARTVKLLERLNKHNVIPSAGELKEMEE